MKKTVVFLVALSITYISFSQNVTSRLDTLLQAYATQYKFNGTVLVAKNGEILLNKGYGYRNAAIRLLHDKYSVFQIGSVTKQFTTAIIQKLQQEGKLNVQDPISKYFPQYPKGDSITIEQLMLHTSGIYSYTNDRTFMQNEVSKPANKEKMIALFRDKPLDFSPGTNWRYSNSAYSLLGYIIESVTGKPYEQVVREYIFIPLKMTHSGFDFTHLQNKEKSIGYFSLTDRDTLKSPIVDSSVAYSAGSIYSTTEDLYRWHQGLQKNIILSNAQQEKAYTPVKNKYGYGWTIDSLYGKRVVAHGGGIHGFTSNFSRLAADDVCIVLLCNTSSPELHNITKSIYAILYNKPYEIPRPRKVISITEEKLKQYIGVYTIKENLQLTITLKDGNLVATPTGQPTAILFPEKEDYFFVKQPEVQLQFTRNEKKEVDGFTLYQNGSEVKCPKIK
ncbi:serine hydrolase [Niastella caeni]|uniref:Serine hydrolase n=1 Tax=Niastella caeni TaxID=2569763 RepID=A0A4S8HA27_9BACT|nr:serine hydrolase [Niastella caeni]THU31527.1 serine hydrolase [Niastella caeni]